MDEWTLVRSFALRIGAAGDTRLSRALDGWAETHAEWLDLAAAPGWTAAREALSRGREGDVTPYAIAVADTLAEVLAFDPFDAALLRLMVGVDPPAAARGHGEAVG